MSDPSQFLLYTAPDGTVKVDVLFKEETARLSQKAIAELFGVKVPAVNKHLKNIFESGELACEATISKMEIVRAEGGRNVARMLITPTSRAALPQGKAMHDRPACMKRRWNEQSTSHRLSMRIGGHVPPLLVPPPLADPNAFKWQIAIANNAESSKRCGRRTLPYAFTEQGVAMLSISSTDH